MKTLLKHLFLLIASVSVIAITSCATLTSDIEIETHSDPAINYQDYKTYLWAGSSQIAFDPVGQWQQPTLDTDEEIRYVINREMRNHGLHQVETNPDLLVAFAAGVDTTVLELKEDPSHGDQVITNVPKAALLIALVDARTGYVVWLGFAIGEVQEQQTIDSIRTRIDYAVSEIFKSYN